MNHFTSIFKTRLKGGALYIAITSGIIIGIILILFILIARYNQRTVTVLAMDSQLMQDLKNGIEMAKSDYFSEAQNGRWIKDSFNDDSVSIKRSGWGAFMLVTVTARNRHHSLSYSGLYGTAMSADTGLLVADNNRPVGLSGNVVFKSNCYLPKAGIKPAYIEGQSYSGSSQNFSFIRPSPGNIPQPNDMFRNSVKAQMNMARTSIDSIVTSLPSTLKHSFSARTIAVDAGRGRLNNINLSGNIKIGGDEVIVDSSAHLEDVLIVCNKIRFSKGFHGSVHVIASDSIIADAGCKFGYPSSFVLVAGDDESSLKCVQFGDNCNFSGAVVAFGVSEGGNGKVFVKLNGKSEMNGFIYSRDYMNVEGKLNASVICTKLLLKTPSAVYENHMLGCEIDPKKYMGVIGIPVIFNRTGNVVCCKAL